MSLTVAVACLWEVTARKIGNVHPGADLPGLTFADFLVSAAAIAPAFTDEPRPLGKLVLDALTRRVAVIDTNTNLGIVLLLAPLHLAHLDDQMSDDDYSTSIATVRSGLTVADARQVYAAIRLAQPGGMGKVAKADLADEPKITLAEAMTLAAGRDAIARQYRDDFADVLDFGVPCLMDGWERFGRVEAAILHLQLAWLAREGDTLIARKFGAAAAEEVRRDAATAQALGGWATTAGVAACRALDARLRRETRNPGTTADLVTACLYVALANGHLTPGAPFAWTPEG